MIDIFATVISWIIGMVVGFVFANGICFIFNLNPPDLSPSGLIGWFSTTTILILLYTGGKWIFKRMTRK